MVPYEGEGKMKQEKMETSSQEGMIHTIFDSCGFKSLYYYVCFLGIKSMTDVVSTQCLKK